MFMIDENHFTSMCIGVTDPLIKVDDPYNPVRVFLFLFVIDKRYNIINTLYLLKINNNNNNNKTSKKQNNISNILTLFHCAQFIFLLSYLSN